MSIWLGYEFTEYDPNATNWNAAPGLYVFVRSGAPGAPDVPLYVGRTGSFASRIPSHPLWGDALRHGANRVDALLERDPAMREELERHLIEGLQPLLNQLLR